jgi:GNAT superfamily N-acetyltransferase
MAGLRPDEAAAWWRKTLSAAGARTVVLVARDDHGIVGTVQLQPAWAPNQPHRADVAKLIVHRRGRRRGIARALMEELERQARTERFTVLLLDTCQGTAAERLYAALGWTRVGVVPNFALNPNGTPCDTVFFYKQL